MYMKLLYSFHHNKTHNVHVHCTCTQGCGNIEPTAEDFGLFLPLLSCSPYTLYTVQFRFTGHSLDLLDNVLHDWLFPHPCMYIVLYSRINIHVCRCT